MGKVWKYRHIYFLVAPAFIWVAIFYYGPIWGITLAFKTFSPTGSLFSSPWAVPLYQNFWFLKDKEFWNVMWNTVKIASVKLAFGFPVPIILALMLNEVRNAKFKKVVQTVVYLPHFISWVIFASIIYRILDYESASPINQALAMVGIRNVALLGEERSFIPIVVVSNIFKEAGWGTIIYLAAISGIDPQLYEAASIDGAGKWVKLYSITLPSLVPIIVLLLILSIPSLLSAGFDQIWNLRNPMLDSVANVTDIYVLRIGIQRGEYSYATALGLIFSTISLGLILANNRLSKQSIGYGIW